jgi:Ala-tRNA(Pro) deacylase
MSLVSDHLEKRGVPFNTMTHTRTYTTLDEAQALSIATDAVLKVVVLKTASGHALAVVPATRRLSMALTRRATGDAHVRLATEAELQQHFGGFELGAVPPLGSLLGVPVFVDPEAMEHQRVVFAAGSQTESILVRTGDLFAREEPTVMPLSSPEEAVAVESAPPAAAKPGAAKPTARKRTTTKKAPKRAVAKKKPATRVTKKKVQRATVKKVKKPTAKQPAKKTPAKKKTAKRAVNTVTQRSGTLTGKKSAGVKKATTKTTAKTAKRTSNRLPRSSGSQRS